MPVLSSWDFWLIWPASAMEGAQLGGGEIFSPEVTKSADLLIPLLIQLVIEHRPAGDLRPCAATCGQRLTKGGWNPPLVWVVLNAQVPLLAVGALI